MTQTRSVLTIGTFDGVHAGHAALLARARTLATTGNAQVVAMAFDPHPLTILRPDQAPARLTSFHDRERLLKAAGADLVARLQPTAEFLSTSPGEFLDRVCQQWAPLAFVEGADFRFGKGRSGDIESLRERGRTAGFQVDVVPPVTVVLGDHTIAPASSTLARWLISSGRIADATVVLGHPYELAGTVERGDRRGRTIGFPTANLRTDCLLPADGVYAAEALLDDGRSFTAAVSVGTKPTFDGSRRELEAFLIDAPTENDRVAGLPEYGWGLRLRLAAWVREQARFSSVASLVEQMHRDCVRIRTLTGEPALPRTHLRILETPACR